MRSPHCNLCGEDDPTQFPPSRPTRCRTCNSNYEREYRRNSDVHHERLRRNVLAKFGLTQKEYDALLAKQELRCAICDKFYTDNTALGKGKERGFMLLAVDHNHETGKVRGLLCRHCNLALGHLNDDPELFEKAAQYLRGAE